MRSYRYLAATAVVGILLGAPSTLWAQVAPDLGAAAPFVVLGTNSVPTVTTVSCTDTGPGVGINSGSVGSTFGSITNVACTIAGPIVTPVGGGVVGAFNSAFNQIDILNPVCTGVIPLAGGILGPGVYCSPAGTTLTGVTITLNGNASDVFIFRVGTAGPGALTLTNSSINLSGGALACNVFFKTSAGFTATDSTVRGTVLSGAGLTTTRGAFVGRGQARTDVVLVDPNMDFAGCAAGAQPPGCPVTSIAPAGAANGLVGTPYSQTFTQVGSAVGGTVFTVPPGTLPAGLTLSAGGVLSGTPTTAEVQTFTIRGADTNGCFATRPFTVTIVGAGSPPAAGCPVLTLSPPTLPNAVVGVPYLQQLTLDGAVTAVTFTRVAGDLLPAGLTLSTAGLISGTPTSPLSVTFTIRATDANGCFMERSYQIVGLEGVPTMPQTFVILMLLGLLFIGYAQLRNRARA